MAEVAKERWPVLIAIFCFDIVTYTFRLGARAILGGPGGLLAMLVSLLPQLTNMVALYGAIHFINRRSRCTVRAGYQARARSARRCGERARPRSRLWRPREGCPAMPRLARLGMC